MTKRMIELITGGARSGKSQFAEDLLKGEGSVTYIASSEVRDEEMALRVKKHQDRRPREWKTWESPLKLGDCPYDTDHYLMDCLTLLTTNHLFHLLGPEDDLTLEILEEAEKNTCQEILKLVTFAREKNKHLIFVTNEVGSGIVPENALSRAFRDLQGRVNQYAGNLVDRVYLVVCGQGLCIKK